jgi:hypothetical protein
MSLIITMGALKLKLKLIYNRRSVGQSILVPGSHLKPMTRFLFSLWQLWISWCRAPSLLLGHARAVTLESESHRTHDHILLSHLRLPQLGVKVKVKVTLRPTASQSVLVSSPIWDFWPEIFSFFFSCSKLRSFLCRAPSLTIGRVCHLSVFVIAVYNNQSLFTTNI